MVCGRLFEFTNNLSKHRPDVGVERFGELASTVQNSYIIVYATCIVRSWFDCEPKQYDLIDCAASVGQLRQAEDSRDKL